MKLSTVLTGLALGALASTAGMAASCNSASQYAPGQQAGPANTSAPGQQAKAKNQPANTFAPGQVKKTSASPTQGCS